MLCTAKPNVFETSGYPNNCRILCAVPIREYPYRFLLFCSFRCLRLAFGKRYRRRRLSPSLFAQLIVGFRLRLYPTYKQSSPCRSDLRIATPCTRLIAQPDLQELEFTTAFFLDTGMLHVVLCIILGNTGPLKTYKVFIYNGEARALYDG